MKNATSTASGILLVDKSGGMTSHDVVARTRRLAGTRKVGHAGTLDPMATGLLILGVNSSTRLLTYVVGLDKEYLATVRLGVATTTDDAEGDALGEPAGTELLAGLTDARLAAAFADQTGEVEQVPSSVSAIKVDGKRAYARVRSGEEVVLAARSVTISEIELLGAPRRVVADDGAPAAGAEVVDVDVRVVCSSGTYIRAIARDVGAALGVGGHLTALRRTRIGPFSVDQASSLDQLGSVVESGASVPLIAAAAAAETLFPVWRLDEAQAVALGYGQRVEAPTELRDAARAGAPVAAITPGGALLGLVEVRGGAAKSVVNFPPDEREVSA